MNFSWWFSLVPPLFSLIQDSNTQSSFYKNDSSIVYKTDYLLYNFPNSDYYHRRQCIMKNWSRLWFGNFDDGDVFNEEKEIRLLSSRKYKHRAYYEMPWRISDLEFIRDRFQIAWNVERISIGKWFWLRFFPELNIIKNGCFTHDWAYLRIYNKPPVHDQQHDVNDENCKKMNDVECIKLWPLKNQPLSLSQLLINGRFKLSLLQKKLSMETSGVRWCDFRLRKKPVFGVYNMVNVVVDSLGERDPACLSLRFLSYFWS